jgi:hypothetical protein
MVRLVGLSEVWMLDSYRYLAAVGLRVGIGCPFRKRGLIDLRKVYSTPPHARSRFIRTDADCRL